MADLSPLENLPTMIIGYIVQNFCPESYVALSMVNRNLHKICTTSDCFLELSAEWKWVREVHLPSGSVAHRSIWNQPCSVETVFSDAPIEPLVLDLFSAADRADWIRVEDIVIARNEEQDEEQQANSPDEGTIMQAQFALGGATVKRSTICCPQGGERPGWTLLHYAAYYGAPLSFVRFLLRRVYHLNWIKTPNGKLPLDLARERKHTHLFFTLVPRRFSNDFPLLSVNERKRLEKWLHVAIRGCPAGSRSQDLPLPQLDCLYSYGSTVTRFWVPLSAYGGINLRFVLRSEIEQMIEKIPEAKKKDSILQKMWEAPSKEEEEGGGTKVGLVCNSAIRVAGGSEVTHFISQNVHLPIRECPDWYGELKDGEIARYELENLKL